MKAPCTDSNDATCVCNYGYFRSEITQRCEPCTVCPLGEGMLYSCEFDHDTMCEECNEDTYSDQESSREPCIPCTTCEGDDTLSPCTSTSDTVCEGKSVPLWRYRDNSSFFLFSSCAKTICGPVALEGFCQGLIHLHLLCLLLLGFQAFLLGGSRGQKVLFWYILISK